MLILVLIQLLCCARFVVQLLLLFVCCSPEVPNVPHRADVQSAFPRDKLEYLNWASSSDTFPKFALLLSFPTYTYHILLGLTLSAGGLTESLVRFLVAFLYFLYELICYKICTCSLSVIFMLSCLLLSLYTVSQKRWCWIFALTLRNLNQYLKFFHC